MMLKDAQTVVDRLVSLKESTGMDWYSDNLRRYHATLLIEDQYLDSNGVQRPEASGFQITVFLGSHERWESIVDLLTTTGTRTIAHVLSSTIEKAVCQALFRAKNNLEQVTMCISVLPIGEV
jgi:hypothetical protein